MATPLVLQFEGEESACHLAKVDRSKLYGYVEKEVMDENEGPCQLVTLASDGKTLIGSGGTTFAYFDPDGLWCDKSDLQPVDMDGEPITQAASSFRAPIELGDEVSPEDYLSYNIRSVYVLDSPEGFSAKLVEALEAGRIFQFPFSYRGGLDPDEGFLFRDSAGTIWLAIGKQAAIRLIGLAEVGAAVEQPEAEFEDDELDLMDFGLI